MCLADSRSLPVCVCVYVCNVHVYEVWCGVSKVGKYTVYCRSFPLLAQNCLRRCCCCCHYFSFPFNSFSHFLLSPYVHCKQLRTERDIVCAQLFIQIQKNSAGACHHRNFITIQKYTYRYCIYHLKGFAFMDTIDFNYIACCYIYILCCVSSQFRKSKKPT